MECDLSLMDKFNLLKKFIIYRIQQYRSGTYEYEIVNISCGQIKGRKCNNLYADLYGSYYAFEGIPYAKKPLGELRFRAPEPAEPWEGVLDCTYCQWKPKQYNYLIDIIEGSEDCLYINVYTKKLQSDQPLPVMVWIYGGGFQFGEASRDVNAPDYFMQHDVVVVTFNYRTGIFGFMCLKDPDLKIPGNAGLKDQVLALKWVNENIHNFNGDPNNITVFGSSAGAASAHIMMSTPQTKGLFHKAILQSGSALCHWAITDRHDFVYKAACYIGYDGEDNDKDVYNFLVQQSSDALSFKSENLLTKEDIVSHRLIVFVPVIEPYTMSDCVIDRPILEMLRNAWGNSIPMIAGGNLSEGLYLYNTVQRHPYVIDELTNYVNLLPNDISQDYDDEELQEMALKIKEVYFKGEKPNMKDHFYSYLDLHNQRMMWHSIARSIRGRCAYAQNTQTFCYLFAFDSNFFNHIRNIKCGNSTNGVCHGDELAYLFNYCLSPKLLTSCREFKCAQRMVAMWYNFALNSDPNCDEIKPTIWKAVAANEEPIKCLSINDDIEFVDLPIYDKIKLWDQFYSNDDLI